MKAETVRRLPRTPTVRVVVTQDIISASTQRDSSHCMIAEAVKAAFPDADRVSVDLQTVRFSDRARQLRYTYLTPRIGQVALIQFDRGDKPEPFSMVLKRGQVTNAGKREVRAVRSPAQRAAAQKSVAKARESMRKAVLKDRSAGSGAVHEKIGGKTPPLDIPFARRRAFGLRMLRG